MFVFTLLFLWLALKFIQKKSSTSIITGYEKLDGNAISFHLEFGVY
jgi:hypothetical protein